MRAELANVVHALLSYGLRLKERLDNGETPEPDLQTEQAQLNRLLSDPYANRMPDFSGDSNVDASMGGGRVDSSMRRTSTQFLGARYALVCWLDELFILGNYSSWGPQWNEQSLETSVFRSRDRAWKFWEEAKRAETRPDALEVFFLCVSLGFRGELRDQPEKLESWFESTRARIVKTQAAAAWKEPNKRQDPSTNVAPRHGREQLQRMVMIGAALLLLLLPVAAFVVVLNLSHH